MAATPIRSLHAARRVVEAAGSSTDSGPGLAWVTSPAVTGLQPAATEHLRILIWEATSELYSPQQLRDLPVESTLGSLILVPRLLGGAADPTHRSAASVRGLLWCTRPKPSVVRVIAFLVTPTAQGRGWGGRGWRLMAERARLAGCSEVSLEVRVDNTRAQAFYARRGLSIHGVLPDHYRGMDGYLMCGPLAPSVWAVHRRRANLHERSTPGAGSWSCGVRSCSRAASPDSSPWA